MPQSFITRYPIDISLFEEFVEYYGYKPQKGRSHDDLRYSPDGVLFTAKGMPDLPVWETVCADGLPHIETFRPPHFISDWVDEGGREYGVFCGLYDDDEDEDEVADVT